MRIRTLASAAVIAGSASPFVEASAQQAGRAVECWRRTGDLGISRLGGGHIRVFHQDDGTMRYRFYTEPAVIQVSGVAASQLRKGDVIVAIDGHLITTPEGSRRFSEIRPGERIELQVRRDGRLRSPTLVAGARCLEEPPEPSTARPVEPSPTLEAGIPPRVYLGLSFRCTNCGVQMEDEVPEWFFEGPLTVTDVHEDSPAWAAGLRLGDELLSIDGHEFATPEGAALFSSLRPGSPVTLTARRPDGNPYTARVVPSESREQQGGSGVGSDAPTTTRYTGLLGDVAIEVRGHPVIVTQDAGDERVTIRSEGLLITLRRLDGHRRDP